MDPRRLDTAEVINAGILAKPAPATDVPTDRERWDNAERDWNTPQTEAVVAALEAGKLVEASNYYGIPLVWKEADGVYHGRLLQYRNVTESPTFTSAQAAAEWFEDTYARTDG